MKMNIGGIEEEVVTRSELTLESLEKCLESGNASYFSHGFPIHFSAYTNIVPTSFVDVVMVAPKGAGPSVRSNFLDGSGINSSYAAERDHTKRALDRTLDRKSVV